MSLKKGLMIILITSILMARLRTARGRIYEGKHKNHREVNKLNYYGLQTRHHNHYLHKKHHKCNSERYYYRQGHGKKPSRYPTLDKIVHRLDNRADFVDKSRLTTTNPFDEWNATTPLATAFPDAYAYAYYTVGSRNGTGVPPGNHLDKESRTKEDAEINPGGHGGDGVGGGDRERKDNNINVIDGNNNVYGRGFLQDHSTSSPWENEQHDVSPRASGSSKEPDDSVSTPPPPSPPAGDARKDFGQLPSWPVGRLLPRVTPRDERKKPTTPMPYVAAHEHYEQVLRKGDCRTPKEKVIRVHEVHPDPSKSYSPSCTILHQCGDDTGCCRDLKQVCKPKNTTKVELYFFTTTMGKGHAVEKLHFVNHTECECQRRTDEAMPRDSEFRRTHLKKVTSSKIEEEKEKRRRNNCTCPSRYSARFFRNESCICDCFDKQDDCLVLKKGKAHFPYQDKLCIQQGTCLPPSCEFGSYIRQFGRCPNRSEKYHYSWSRILSYRDLIT